MTPPNLVARIEALERQVAELKQHLAPQPTPWWEQIAGTFEGDPLHHKAARAGTAYRRASRRPTKSPAK